MYPHHIPPSEVPSGFLRAVAGYVVGADLAIIDPAGPPSVGPAPDTPRHSMFHVDLLVAANLVAACVGQLIERARHREH
eukprot:SAG31_NODE_310_length_17887_cov_4.623060_8_plen_79_part_00